MLLELLIILTNISLILSTHWQCWSGKKSLNVILLDKQCIPHILAENLKGPLNVRLGRVIAWINLELRADASPCLIAPVCAGGYGFSGV